MFASGLTFDLVLAAVLVALALWEGIVALRRREKKRIPVIVLAVLAALVLVWLRLPQL